jgi:hypothetical protein
LWARPGAYPTVEHFKAKMLHLGWLQPYLQTIDKPVNACQGQALLLQTFINNGREKFYSIRLKTGV